MLPNDTRNFGKHTQIFAFVSVFVFWAQKFLQLKREV
jgi:hypothetical protein